jgi:hypothetical protein
MPSGDDSLTQMAFFGRDDKQWEQLRALYGERSDAELLAMYDQRDGLTEAAQQALETVMRERHLQAVAPAAAPVDAEADAVDMDELLYIFDDAFDAREAMRYLTEAEVTHRIVDWHTVDLELRKVRPTLQLGLLVPKNEQTRAKDILRESLDLFPDDADEVSLNPIGELALVAMFDLKDGLVAAQALAEGGISYFWRDGRDESQELPDAETVAIEVRVGELHRATKLVEERLATLPD